MYAYELTQWRNGFEQRPFVIESKQEIIDNEHTFSINKHIYNKNGDVCWSFVEVTNEEYNESQFELLYEG
mgnify:CR=1 FL=1